jgi:glycosyltransferase involved in cell wall biosynthesis
LIGAGQPPEVLRAARRDSSIEVLGLVPDLEAACRDAAALICPLRVGGGTRLKVLHAFGMGLPVVSTAIGVEGLDVRDGEHYLRAESADQFVDQLAALRRPDARANSLRKAARTLVEERYDWDGVADALFAAYDAAAELHSRGRMERSH